MCGDALLVAPIVREGGEVEIALPPGGWYDLNTRQRYRRPAGAALPREARPVPGVRARGLRAAAGPRRPAHGRDRRRAAARAAVGVRQADGGARRGSRRRGSTSAATTCHVRVAHGVKVELFGDAAERPRRAAGVTAMLEKPALAITSGEPAGIGPELVAMLAARHRDAPFRGAPRRDRRPRAARRARGADRRRAAVRRLRPGRVRAGGRRRRDLAPAGRGAGHPGAARIPPTPTAS